MGRQALPKEYRRSFDVVTCSGNLGTNLMPASCFEHMLGALKAGGLAVFTVSQKHLNFETNFGMRYAEAI